MIVAAVVLEATACLQYFYTRSALRYQAELRARTELRRAEQEIAMHTIEMETAAKMLAMMAERHYNTPDSVYSATRALVSLIANTSSVAVAYVPDYFPERGRYFEVCSSRISPDSIYTRQIGSAEHDYTLLEWYQNGLRDDSCSWSEPYHDDAGSRTFVVSCSCPVHDAQGRTVAVVCVDLSLDYMQHISEYLQLYSQDSYCSIRSAKGVDIVARPDTTAGRKYEIFDQDIEATGWKLTVIIPEDVIYADLRRVGLVVSIMMLIGLLALVFIMYRSALGVMELISLGSQQERIESELNIARSIQMAMLPTRFPPFPDYPNLNAYGIVDPAKAVGGDLFDFYIRDSRLFFCIGDVSGKGVPASLVMAVTRSLFRSYTSYIDSPAKIVSQMNDALSTEENTMNMFVTLFLGMLDLRTGAILYCNAGHDSPIQFTQAQPLDARILHCVPNLPLGVMAGFAYAEQSARLNPGDTMFLFTDGLNEAENSSHEQFGTERVVQTLAAMSPDTREQSREVIAAMQQAVKLFVGGAEQSDDLTMFAVRFIEKYEEDADSAKQKKSNYSLVMRNDIQQIPTLAEWIESIGIPQELNMPINLALEEAVSNVMLYAYPETNSGRVLVEAEKTDGQIVFTISDSGIPFDPTQQKEADITLSVEDRAIGGLGIHLVRQIMDDVQYERKENKNILTLTKRI